MKKNSIFIIAISFVGILAMSGCSCGISEPTGSLNGNGYVDLGLPSGTLWATCNIGADEPNDAGSYFAYGETTPKWMYFDDNYSYRFRTNTLQPSDDAATYNWGNNWRMPTDEDFKELISNCRWEWTSHYFKKGYKITGPNGNSIFLPTTGEGNGAKTLTKYGYYRTSSAIFINDDVLRGWTAFTFLFSEDSYRIEDVMPRPVDGVAIRPVSSGNGSSKTSSVKETKTKGSCNGHDWVDLGLPSGTKWATCNVGANKPEDYGNYYAWGESRTKSSYTESNYTYFSNPTKLPASADAATVNWGVGWRMPTKDEFKELKDKCTWKWVSDVGYKIIGPNDNSIFLPAASYLDYIYTDLQDAPPKGFDGFYWSSSLYSDGRAWFLYFYSDNYDMRNECSFVGLSVRPVFNPN